MRRKQTLWMTMAAGAALMGLAACASDETAQVEQLLQEGKIVFSVKQEAAGTTRSVSAAVEPLKLSGAAKDYWLLVDAECMTPGVTTRGTQLTPESFMTDFGVSAYKTPSSMADLDNRKPDYFYNLQATRVGESADYTVSQDYYWPSNDERLWFYAYYPYNGSNSAEAGDNLNVVLSSAEAAGPQTIDYTVASAAADQVDLMTAHTGQTSGFLTQSAPRVDLTFEHQLCGIRFKVGSQFPTKGYIQSIQLKNVYTHGVYTIGSSWSHADGDLGDFTVSYDNDTKMTDTPGQMITDDDAVFLMIPTTFTYEDGTADEDKAKIIVQFWDGDARHTVEASLEGTTWTAGETVTYSLSSEKLTTLKIDHIDYAETVTGAPYTDWQNGDEVGLYVVANGQGGGTDLRYTNVKCTYTKANDATAGTWVIAKATVKDATTNKDIQVTPIMYPGDNYYFYYPYNASGPAGTPSAGNEGDASADKFWSSVIAAHTVQTDQSAPASFKQSDLQVAKAVVPTAGNGHAASTIMASMARQVGLAVVAIGKDNANNVVTYTNNDEGTVTEVIEVTASTTFSGKIPRQNGSKYYYYTRAGEETSINSSSTEVDVWEASLNFTLAAGDSEEQTAHSDRKNWPFISKGIYNYEYTKDVVEFTALYDGTVLLEVWGASGGNSTLAGKTAYGGKGGYAKGSIDIEKDTKYYVCVGGAGEQGTPAICALYGQGRPYGGYNGGRQGGWYEPNQTTWSGSGGATHIAKNQNLGELKNYVDNKDDVLIVAGAGGGAAIEYAGRENVGDTSKMNSRNGGYGGGLTGGNGATGDVAGVKGIATGGTQTEGGKGFNSWDDAPEAYGSFGYGGRRTVIDSSCGGAGWYGGGAAHNSASTGAGGSSYYGSLTGGSTIAGNASQTQPDGATATGHSGNGYARITLTRK